MVGKVILSIVVGIVVAVVVKIVGAVLVDSGASNTGSYLNAVAALLGLAAGLWYYFAGTNPAQRP